MAPFDRRHTTFYWSGIVSIALSCTILKSRVGVTQDHWKWHHSKACVLLAFHSNYVSNLHHFGEKRDIRRQSRSYLCRKTRMHRADYALVISSQGSYVRQYLCFFYPNIVIFVVLDVPSLPLQICQTSIKVFFTLIKIFMQTYIFVYPHHTMVGYWRDPDFSFLCTFVPGSEKSTERTFALAELLRSCVHCKAKILKEQM